MQISTETNFSGVAESHPWSAQFTVLGYTDGAISTLPHQFFRDWLDQEPAHGHFYIGRGSCFGVGSLVKYDGGQQSLCVGRYVAGGSRLSFILNGQHEMRTISTYMLSILGGGLKNLPPPQYPDTVIKNDVWIGDEAMVLGGSVIENGCVIGARSLLPPNFRSEPYGIYAGSPARLIRYRFTEKVRAALLELAWWEMPLEWVRNNNAMFLEDLCADEAKALLVINILKSSRQQWEAEHGGVAD
ncbi:acetyltransferase [Janthinobacterium sp. BJB301]|uniref:acetyltransferase n=1 Tax=Janthinobacterium sp. BJB301 TaxID=1560195 RepID=UPI000C0DD60E|nr:acetyltransferase [Janthinobacterium sp. BJB301]PHV50363.1 acetyltransferase [Janthinobacterium sp. BJB301]